MTRSRRILGTVAVISVAALGTAGYVVGSGEAPTAAEAEEAAEATFDVAYENAHGLSLADAVSVGASEGRIQGTKAGSREGAKQGHASGSSLADAELASQAAAEAEAAAAAAAEAEVYCPIAADNSATQADCDALGAEESYCGGFDPSRVQADGSYLPKPGC